VREAQKRKGLRLSFATPLSILSVGRHLERSGSKLMPW
jgi:hypothetical protein